MSSSKSRRSPWSDLLGDTGHDCAFKAQYEPLKIIPVGLTCAFIIAWYLQLGGRVAALGAIRFEFFLGATLVVLSLFAKRKNRLSNQNPLASYIALYLLALVIQVPLSADVTNSWNVFVDRIVKFSMIALFISSFIDSPKSLRIFLVAWFLAVFKIASEGFIGWYTGSMVWQNQGIMRLHGSTGNYVHPNSFSGFAVGVLPFIYFLFPLWGRYGRVALLMLLAFILVIIIFTGSRTGYVGTIGVLCYILYVSQRRARLIVGILAAVFVGLASVPSDYFERFESIFTLEEREGRSSEKRLEIIEDAVAVFIDHPFGVGVGAFPVVRMATFGRSQDTHNLYLEVLTNLGIQGFVVFSLLVLKLLRLLRRMRLSFDSQISMLREQHFRAERVSTKVGAALNGHLEDVFLLRAVAMAVSAFVIARLCLGLFGMDLYEIYWWLAIGLCLSLYRAEKIAARRTEEIVSMLNTAQRESLS